MLECMEAVRLHSTPNDPWVAVDIRPEGLVSSVDVVTLVIDTLNTESGRLSKAVSGAGTEKIRNLLDGGRKLYRELSERGVGIAGVSVGGKSRDDRAVTVFSRRVFQHAAGLLKNFHIVAFVDEAQNTLVKDTTKGVLDCLHSPPQGIPLVAVFFGLGDTEEMLRKCGLSRPPDERAVNLERLDHEEASESIRGAFKAYGFAGSWKDREAWVEHLAQLSQGWPQHINRVAVAAAQVIVDHGGQIEMNYL